MTMKTNCWLILGMLITTGALAQNNTNALPPMPAPIVAPTNETVPPVVTQTNGPVLKQVKPKKHRVVAPKRIALVEPTVALLPGTAEVTVSNLNVRGQAGLRGEVISHLTKGETVTIINQINLDKHSIGEPAQWVKIILPASTKTWLNTQFIAANKTVSSRKLNLRAGPGENYSILGVIERGTPVNEITTKGGWAQIEPPTNAYAFVAAMYLKQEASGTMASNPAPSTETEPMPAPVPTPVAETPPVVTEPTNATAAMETNSAAPPITDTNTAMVMDTNPPPPRIVSHEGVVGHVDSIIAPTAYVLYDPATHKEINFLYTTSPSLDISRYYGMRIVVTGEEALAQRWQDTPVLTIQRIEVLATNVIPKVYYPAPRQRR